jgi:hypothetical protein
MLETDFRLRAAISRGIEHVLSTATRHPNNLARAKQAAAGTRTAAEFAR